MVIHIVIHIRTTMFFVNTLVNVLYYYEKYNKDNYYITGAIIARVKIIRARTTVVDCLSIDTCFFVSNIYRSMRNSSRPNSPTVLTFIKRIIFFKLY